MARKAIRGPLQDEAGNRIGSGTQVNVYTDEAHTTLATLFAETTGATTIAQPLVPNAGKQTTLKVGSPILSTDTFITVIDTSTFHVGDRLYIADGTNTRYKTITAINADGANTLRLSSATGVGFAVANTQIGGPHMQGQVSIVVADTADTYIVVKDLGSGVLMDDIQILTSAPLANLSVQDEGTLINSRGIINIVGPGFAATDDAPNSRINVTLDPNGFILEGTLAGRPAAAILGRLYVTTDETGGRRVYRDTGAAWNQIAHGIGQLITAGMFDDTAHGVRAVANAHAHSNLSGVTADQHHVRTEAKETAGAAASESVTWTTAFGSTPVVTTGIVVAAPPINPSEGCTVTSRSTTGATLHSQNATGTNSTRVKMCIAQVAT